MLLFLIKCYGGVSCVPVPDLTAEVGQYEETGPSESEAHTSEEASAAPAAALDGVPIRQNRPARPSSTKSRSGPAVLRAMSEWRRRLLQHGGGVLMFRRHTLFQSYRSGDVEIERAHEHVATGGLTAAVLERVCQDACATAPRKLRRQDASVGESTAMSQIDDLRSAIRDLVGRELDTNDDFGRIESESETWHWSAADCVGPSAVGTFTGRVQAPLGEVEALGSGQSTGYGEDRTAAGSGGGDFVHDDAFPVFRHASASGWETGSALDQVGGLEQLMTEVVADELGVSPTAVHWMVSCITDLLLAAAAESPEWVLETSAASDSLDATNGIPTTATERAEYAVAAAALGIWTSSDAEGEDRAAHESNMDAAQINSAATASPPAADADGRVLDVGGQSLGRPRLQLRNDSSHCKSDLLRHLYKLHGWKLPSAPSRESRQTKRQPATSNASTGAANWAAINPSQGPADSPNSSEDRNVAAQVQSQYDQNQLQRDHEVQVHEQEEAYDGGGEGEDDQERGADSDHGNTVDEIVAKSRKRKRQRKRDRMKNEKKHSEQKREGQREDNDSVEINEHRSGKKQKEKKNKKKKNKKNKKTKRASKDAKDKA